MDARQRANVKWRAKAKDQIQFTVPKGDREGYKKQAEQRGLTFNAYLIRLLQMDTRRLAAGLPMSAQVEEIEEATETESTICD